MLNYVGKHNHVEENCHLGSGKTQTSGIRVYDIKV